MVIKLERKVLPCTAEDLPYSVLLISADHASLSLSPPFFFGGNAGIRSASLYFSLKAKVKLKCIKMYFKT